MYHDWPPDQDWSRDQDRDIDRDQDQDRDADRDRDQDRDIDWGLDQACFHFNFLLYIMVDHLTKTDPETKTET